MRDADEHAAARRGRVAVGQLPGDAEVAELRDRERPTTASRCCGVVERPDRDQDAGRVLEPRLVVAAVREVRQPGRRQLDPPAGIGLGQRGASRARRARATSPRRPWRTAAAWSRCRRARSPAPPRSPPRPWRGRRTRARDGADASEDRSGPWPSRGRGGRRGSGGLRGAPDLLRDGAEHAVLEPGSGSSQAAGDSSSARSSSSSARSCGERASTGSPERYEIRSLSVVLTAVPLCPVIR